MDRSTPPISPSSVRVLAIHAHPDDVEFQCAGTLALLRQAGCAVTIATMTPGDCGSAEHDAEAISQIRRAEAAAAAALIGAEYVCLEFRDLAVFNDDDSRRRVVECLRRTRPDLILTAPPVDYCRHEMTSLPCATPASARPIPTATAVEFPALGKIPHLYFVDALEGSDRDGNPLPAGFHVDVTPVFETKRAMLACHASQRNWLLRQHGIDPVDAGRLCFCRFTPVRMVLTAVSGPRSDLLRSPGSSPSLRRRPGRQDEPPITQGRSFGAPHRGGSRSGWRGFVFKTPEGPVCGTASGV
ncbi:MAG: PIG-L deacetylase family protein [Isosphaeraceae bacterium]